MTADWSRSFDDPIPLPGREPLTTLRQAGEYIAALPAKDQHQEHWQTAAEILLKAAEGRDLVMHARIAMLRGAAPRRPAPAGRAAPETRKKISRDPLIGREVWRACGRRLSHPPRAAPA